jgi:ribosome modulation factor
MLNQQSILSHRHDSWVYVTQKHQKTKLFLVDSLRICQLRYEKKSAGISKYLNNVTGRRRRLHCYIKRVAASCWAAGWMDGYDNNVELRQTVSMSHDGTCGAVYKHTQCRYIVDILKAI